MLNRHTLSHGEEYCGAVSTR